MTQRDGMGREEGSGWGTHVYLWWIHFDIWQNQYNIVKFKNKIKLKEKKSKQVPSRMRYEVRRCDPTHGYCSFVEPVVQQRAKALRWIHTSFVTVSGGKGHSP